jgi:hypothetical protein
MNIFKQYISELSLGHRIFSVLVLLFLIGFAFGVHYGLTTT